MKPSFFAFAGRLIALLSVLAAPSCAAENQTPQGVLIEAEAKPVAGDRKVLLADGASGSAVSSEREWQPLFSAPPPLLDANQQVDGQAANAWTIWIRHKNGPLLLKAADQNGQRDLQWIRDAPADWKWTPAGTYAPDQLGDQILVIHGPKQDKPQPLLDAIIFAPAVIKTLPPFEPDAKLAPLTVEAKVDWTRKVATVKPTLWGVNDYEILDPKTAADPKYQAWLAQIKTPLVRIHSGGISDAWTNKETHQWDVEKIRAGFANSSGLKGAKKMLNIAHWPAWLSDQSTLTPAQETQWADSIADLVRLMRDDLKIPIDYWELSNELDGTYEKEGKLDDLWRLFNKLAAAVRKANPTAKIGGPAFTWPKAQWLEGFFKNCGQNVDFVTWHNYASGDINDSNELVLSKSEVIAGMAKSVQEAAAKWAPGRKLEFFLDEYNIKWVWEPIERRHGNNIGALFQASTLRHLAPLQLDGVAVWHAKGSAYGLVDADDTVRATGHLYEWGTQFLVGDLMTENSSDQAALEILPIVRANGGRSLLLLCKANRSVIVPNGAALLGEKPTHIRRIDANGLHDAVEMPANGDWTLPGYSLTLITSGD